MSEARDSRAADAAREDVGSCLALAPLQRARHATAKQSAGITGPGFDPCVAVPFAFDESGKRVRAVDRPDREGGNRSYTCPFCGGAVVLRESSRLIRNADRSPIERRAIRPHWVHRHETCFIPTNPSRSRASAKSTHAPESVLHKRIKWFVVFEVEEWKDGQSEAPQIEYPCRVQECSEITKVVRLDDNITRAVEEHAVASGHVLDVALLAADGNLILGVEIYVTHQVGHEKRAAMDTPWIELDAVGYKRGSWRVRQGSELLEPCERCRMRLDAERAWWAEIGDDPEVTRFIQREREFRLANLSGALAEKEERQIQAQAMRDFEIRQTAEKGRRRVIEVARLLSCPIPRGYNAHRWYCHECMKPMLVFSWLGRREGRLPPEPRPPGLELGRDHQWSQHCPHCEAAQSIRWRRRSGDEDGTAVGHEGG